MVYYIFEVSWNETPETEKFKTFDEARAFVDEMWAKHDPKYVTPFITEVELVEQEDGTSLPTGDDVIVWSYDSSEEHEERQPALFKLEDEVDPYDGHTLFDEGYADLLDDAALDWTEEDDLANDAECLFKLGWVPLSKKHENDYDYIDALMDKFDSYNGDPAIDTKSALYDPILAQKRHEEKAKATGNYVNAHYGERHPNTYCRGHGFDSYALKAITLRGETFFYLPEMVSVQQILKEYDSYFDGTDPHANRKSPEYDGRYELPSYDIMTDTWDGKPAPDFRKMQEDLEANEDYVECIYCLDLKPKVDCKHSSEYGWICKDCAEKLAAEDVNPHFDEPSDPTAIVNDIVSSWGASETPTDEAYNNDEFARYMAAAKKLGLETARDLVKFSEEHGGVQDKELLKVMEEEANKQESLNEAGLFDGHVRIAKYLDNGTGYLVSDGKKYNKIFKTLKDAEAAAKSQSAQIGGQVVISAKENKELNINQDVKLAVWRSGKQVSDNFRQILKAVKGAKGIKDQGEDVGGEQAEDEANKQQGAQQGAAKKVEVNLISGDKDPVDNQEELEDRTFTEQEFTKMLQNFAQMSKTYAGLDLDAGQLKSLGNLIISALETTFGKDIFLTDEEVAEYKKQFEAAPKEDNNAGSKDQQDQNNNAKVEQGDNNQDNEDNAKEVEEEPDNKKQSEPEGDKNQGGQGGQVQGQDGSGDGQGNQGNGSQSGDNGGQGDNSAEE